MKYSFLVLFLLTGCSAGSVVSPKLFYETEKRCSASGGLDNIYDTTYLARGRQQAKAKCTDGTEITVTIQE